MGTDARLNFTARLLKNSGVSPRKRCCPISMPIYWISPAVLNAWQPISRPQGGCEHLTLGAKPRGRPILTLGKDAAALRLLYRDAAECRVRNQFHANTVSNP